MMKTSVFMNIVDYERQKHHWTVRYLCEEYDVEKKDYEYYLKGIKTPPPGSVWMRLCRGMDMKQDIEMAIILIAVGILGAWFLVSEVIPW